MKFRPDRYIRIEAKVVTKDASGGSVESWALFQETWAEKADQGSREFRQAGTTIAEVTTIWRIRYIRELKAEHRINYQGRIFEIIGKPIEIGRQEGWIVQTREMEANRV